MSKSKKTKKSTKSSKKPQSTRKETTYKDAITFKNMYRYAKARLRALGNEDSTLAKLEKIKIEAPTVKDKQLVNAIFRALMYQNPDPRCTYPFDCSPLGYCWSFAYHIDGDTKYDDMTKICPGCECWKGDKENASTDTAKNPVDKR
jgi:hypothetical protein